MNKAERIQIKKLLLIIGLAVIAMMITMNIVRLTGTEQPEGEYITIEDAAILAKALKPEIVGTEAYGRLYANLPEQIATGSYVTYEMYKEFVQLLAPEWKDTLADKYAKDNYVLIKDDWYAFFNEMVTVYGMQDAFHEEELTVLSTDAVYADGTPVGENVLVADKELYRYESSTLESTLFQPISVVMKEDTILTIRSSNASEYSLCNVWIMETEEAAVRCFWKNTEFTIPITENVLFSTASGMTDAGKTAAREQIADISFTEGQTQKIYSKTEKVNGKLLAVKDGVMEIEGVGTLPFTDNFKIYKLYGTLESYYTSNLRVGYDFTDFVIEDGKICACLVTRDEAMETIRVLIKGSDYEGRAHETVRVSADCGYEVRYQSNEGSMAVEHRNAEEEIEVDSNSQNLQGGRMSIVPDALTGRITISSIHRSQGIPAYRGTIEIVKTDEGLIVINEVLLEEYLYAVVPSEMPASYPLEALKSQAVCARTYAYRSMVRAGLPAYGAHVDDSTTYQVYNNIVENAETTKAVKETAGELLYADGELLGAYYYSTSCGCGTDADIWRGGSKENLDYLVPKRISSMGDTEEINALSLKEEAAFAAFIREHNESDYESEEAWYRWTYYVEQVDEEILLQRLQTRYQVNEKLICTWNENDYISQPIEKLGKIKDIRTESRGDGGVIDELIIEGEEAVIKVITEQNIRYVLNNGTASVLRQDGSEAASPNLLPSAFFVIEAGKEEDCVVAYKLIGGGYGHGVGMSQNAAKAMAVQGMQSTDILGFFYDGSEIRNIYEGT